MGEMQYITDGMLKYSKVVRRADGNFERFIPKEDVFYVRRKATGIISEVLGNVLTGFMNPSDYEIYTEKPAEFALSPTEQEKLKDRPLTFKEEGKAPPKRGRGRQKLADAEDDIDEASDDDIDETGELA